MSFSRPGLVVLPCSGFCYPVAERRSATARATVTRRRRGGVRWKARGETHQIGFHVVAVGGAVRALSGKVSGGVTG